VGSNRGEREKKLSCGKKRSVNVRKNLNYRRGFGCSEGPGAKSVEHHFGVGRGKAKQREGKKNSKRSTRAQNRRFFFALLSALSEKTDERGRSDNSWGTRPEGRLGVNRRRGTLCIFLKNLVFCILSLFGRVKKRRWGEEKSQNGKQKRKA